MDLKETFYKKMIIKELEKSSEYGRIITTPRTSFGRAKNEKEVFLICKEHGIEINSSLKELYSQVKKIDFNWELYENDKFTITEFKQDEWLIENYFEEANSWNLVNKIFCGNLHIPPIEDLLGRHKNNRDGYYVVMDYIGLNPNLYCPFDYHDRFTALLKINRNFIEDHIWLLDLDAQKLFDMKLTIEKYLNLAYRAKIFNGWQSVYMFKKKSEFYGLMKRFLPKMVPHVKLDLRDFNM